MNEKVIYFSLNSTRKNNFYQYIRKQRICYTPKFSFALECEGVVFDDPRDLITIIEKIEKKDSLHIIIDYVSCCGKGEEENYSTAIRDIIMCYPEVQFLFDETYVRKEYENRKASDKYTPKYSFMNFLFRKAVFTDVTLMNVLAEFHQFDLGDFKKETIKDQFIRLLKGCNNMYDGSNLRHAIKWFKRDRLGVSSNYENLQTSRSDYIAVVVEEEYHQNMFNSYCLYVNGFRVLPIVSVSELLWINRTIKNHKDYFYCTKENGGIEKKPLLFRDYDLQFVDEGSTSSGVKTGGVTVNGQSLTLNEIDWIRGAKRIEKPVKKYALIGKNKDIDFGDNPYWNEFDEDNIYFASKGGDGICVDYDFDKPMAVDEDGELCLRGVEKPIEGVYVSLREDFDFVRKRYDRSRENRAFVTSRTGISGHSCPLDIYGITRSMVHRAEDYYQKGANRLAALVAGEALEVLNGFHRSLMYKAYYIQAVAENAMAMSLLGGDEGVLRKDVKFRLRQKVISDVERMMPHDEEYRYNLLYNIFNDCMLFCIQKEYFEAADEALSVMVHEKEGMSLADFVNRVEVKIERVFCLFGKLFKTT